MSRKTYMLAGFLFVAIVGCGAMERPRVDPRIASQVIVAKGEPPAGCSYVKPIRGEAIVGTLSEANADLVRNAVLNGGNYVVVEMTERNVGGYMLEGRLFTCGGGPVAPMQVAANNVNTGERRTATDASDNIVLPKAICEPSCSPGFTCLHAICVTACNPACGAGEQCGDDRMCHAAQR